MPTEFLRILLLNVFINSGMGIIIPVLPTYLKHDGFTTAGLSLPFLVLILGRFLSKYYAGKLIGFLGDKWVLIACFLLYSSVFAIYPHSQSALMFTLLRLFEGCVEGISIICLTDMAIVNSTNNRGKLMGYFGSSFGLGFILGPLLGGLLYQYFNAEIMFYSGTLMGLLGAGICFSLENKSITKKATPVIRKKWRVYFPYISGYMPSLLRRALFFAFMILIPLYTTEHLGLSVANAGWYFSGSAVITTLLMPFTGKLADKFSATKITIFSLLLMGILIATFGLTNNLYAFTWIFILETITFAFMLPAGTKIFADSVADHPQRQDIIGYFGSVTELATLFLAVCIPSLYAFDAKYAWFFLGVLCITCGIALLHFKQNAVELRPTT